MKNSPLHSRVLRKRILTSPRWSKWGVLIKRMKVCHVRDGEMRGQSIELKTEAERTAFLMTGKRWGFKVVTRQREIIFNKNGRKQRQWGTFGWRLT